MDSLVVQTVVGLVFVFATFAALVTVMTETTSRVIGLRGEYLLRGLRTLLDGGGHFELRPADLLRRTSLPPSDDAAQPWVTQMLRHPIISASADQSLMPSNAGNAKLSGRDRRRLPSYISSRSFATALINLLVPNPAGQTTMDEVKAAVTSISNIRLRTALLALADAAASDVDRFRSLVEQWYDDHMARVSGWYKRHVRWISLAIAAVLVILFNLSAVQIARSLYTDQVLNNSVVTTATSAAKCQDLDPAQCLQALRTEVQHVRGAGLPLGWVNVPQCDPPVKCRWLSRHGLSHPGRGFGQDLEFMVLLLVGWVLMTAAILPGARFWFDALARLGTLRSTGPKPAST